MGIMIAREKALNWYNSLGRVIREDLSTDYYGNTLLTDAEIIEMYFEEVTHYDSNQVVKLLHDAIIAYDSNKHFDFTKWISENLLVTNQNSERQLVEMIASQNQSTGNYNFECPNCRNKIFDVMCYSSQQVLECDCSQ